MAHHPICIFILSLFCSHALAGKTLIVSDTNTNRSPDRILRGYTLYAKDGQSASVRCRLPNWFNATAVDLTSNPPTKWAEARSSEPTLNIDSTAKSNEYRCSTDKKAGFDDTKLTFYRASRDVVMTGPPISVLNYSITNHPPLIFSCSVSPANSTVTWYLDGKKMSDGDKNLKIYTNNTIVVSYPTFNDVGIYMCKVNPDEKRLDFFSLEGAPFFPAKHGKTTDSENKLEGESITIIHEVYGNPLPDLKWGIKKDEDDALEEINDDYVKSNPRLKIYPTMNVSNGELELSDLKTSTDRAYYVSNATNDHGSSQFTTLVRVKGKLDALWPFLGIVAEVIILVAIILIYERRRLKRDREADEAMDQKKPLTPTNNDSVRQRKN